MMKFIKLVFTPLGLFYIVAPIILILIFIVSMIGKAQYCLDKYDGFKAAYCFFSDNTRN